MRGRRLVMTAALLLPAFPGVPHRRPAHQRPRPLRRPLPDLAGAALARHLILTPPTTTEAATTARPSTTKVSRSDRRPAMPPARRPVGASSPPGASVSWYAQGSRTASGERFDPDALTFASPSMPFGTVVRFCHDGRCVTARCTDRGPFVPGRSFDLSRVAFAAIAPLGAGVTTVTWENV